MGCQDSRIDLTAEEAAIMNAESLLEYSSLSALDVDKIHRKYSYEGTIFEDQWHEIRKILKLKKNIRLYTSQEITDFTGHFQILPGQYSLKKLLVLGILLSTGSIEEKSKLLFEVEDEESKKILNKKKIKELVNMIIEIPIEITSNIEFTDPVNNVTRNDIKKYIQKLKRGKENCAKIIIDKILEGKEWISIEEFSIKMKNDNFEELLSTHGVRKFVKEQLFLV